MVGDFYCGFVAECYEGVVRVNGYYVSYGIE